MFQLNIFLLSDSYVFLYLVPLVEYTLKKAS